MKYPDLYVHFYKIFPLPKEEWRFFEDLLKVRTMKKKDFFATQGEEASKFAIVTRGVFRLYFKGKDRKEYTKSFRGPLEIIGPYAELIQGIPSRLNIECLAPAEILEVDYKAFTALYDRNPIWNGLGRVVAERHFVLKDQREAELLTMSAEERLQAFEQQFKDYLPFISQNSIASYLGITPVALSRIKNKK